MLSGSKTMLSQLNDFQFFTDERHLNRVPSVTYLGIVLDEKWKWKMHINSLLQKLGHRLPVLNRIYHMLHKRRLIVYFNGLVLPHLNYADVVGGDKPGLTIQMKQLQSFQNRFAKKIVKAHQLRPWHCCSGSRCARGISVIDLVLCKMHWGETFPSISIFSILTWLNRTVIILEMVTCPKSAGQERNGAETKIIIKQLTIGPYCRASSRD